MKKLVFSALCIILFTLFGCVKAASNLAEDIDQRAKCAEFLSSYSAETDQTCAQQKLAIDTILKDCGKFLSENEKDDLNFARENCTEDD